MIYWLTGQPGAGKTVLGKLLKQHIERHDDMDLFHIDGDDLRNLLINKDYSKQGRETNIRTAQSIALYLHNQGFDVVVSLVSPYRELREEFKNKTDVIEIYVHTTEERGKEEFHVTDYEEPLTNFIDVDTTLTEPIESLNSIIKHANFT